MISTKQFIGTGAFDELSTWDEVAAGSMTDTPFQRMAYQRGWWQNLGEGELHTIAVYQNESVIGIGCFNVRGDRVVFNASKEETDYLDVGFGTALDARLRWRRPDGKIREEIYLRKLNLCYSSGREEEEAFLLRGYGRYGLSNSRCCSLGLEDEVVNDHPDEDEEEAEDEAEDEED